MPNYIRDFIPGATYFFTVALADRDSDLLVREVDALRQAWAAVAGSHPFRTIAVCILPDHLHAIWRLPPGDARAPMRWGQIKRRFSHGLAAAPPRRASQRARREKGVWQRRYWEHRIRDEEDLETHVNYIHWNPVKHGLVRRVGDWPFSSFHRWVLRGDLPPEWGLVSAADGDDGRYGE